MPQECFEHSLKAEELRLAVDERDHVDADTVSSGVCAYRLFSTTSATSPRLSSMTTRMPSLSDSSRRSEMPSISLLRASSAMRSSRRALFTW
jgi:hypothetical protein